MEKLEEDIGDHVMNTDPDVGDEDYVDDDPYAFIPNDVLQSRVTKTTLQLPIRGYCAKTTTYEPLYNWHLLTPGQRRGIKKCMTGKVVGRRGEPMSFSHLRELPSWATMEEMNIIGFKHVKIHFDWEDENGKSQYVVINPNGHIDA